MKRIESYWCEDRPSLEDIKFAYDRVLSADVVVEIEWFVRYNGKHSRIITRSEIEDCPDYHEYFKIYIPHCYGV